MQTLTLEQAIALANELTASCRWPELESLARTWVLMLKPSKVRDQLTETLIQALFKQARNDEALDLFLNQALDLPRRFLDVYVLAMSRTQAMPVPLNRAHRLYRLSRLVEESLALEGETAECGCFRGLSSYVICAAEKQYRHGYDGRSHHVFDSFQGLSPPQAEDQGTDHRVNGMTKAGAFRASLDEVQTNLSDFPGIDYQPGWLPDSLRGIAERHYRFVHLDLDLYAPTAGALDYFWTRLVPGGYVVCDDYGWPGGRLAVDQFTARSGASVETSAFNQAWLRKL